MDLPKLGVGITYSSAVEPLLEQHPELFDVVELEPQTTWIETRKQSEPYRIPDAVLEHIGRLPGRKLVHSIGVPVGGTVRPNAVQLELLCRTVAKLRAPWVSEHLSFNATPEFKTGFFLPPRQTTEGVETVVAAIRDLQKTLPVPVAIETGVNYLRPRNDEMPDGAFVRAVAESAQCGILLDLHNIFTNALNGRQSVDDFLAEIPLESVWEMHLAGGFDMEGFWLDAHSDAVPDSLMEIAARVVPGLPNLKAIIFEVYPSFVPVLGLDAIRVQIEKLHGIWDRRRGPRREPPPVRKRVSINMDKTGLASPESWERALGGLVIGRPATDDMGRDLAADPGVGIVNRLVKEFRASMIVGALRLTSRLMMLALGPDVFRAILDDFWSKTPPQQFASSEAEAFAEYLEALDLKLPQLAKVLEFERAALATLMDEHPRVVAFDLDPLPLLRALADGRLPDMTMQSGRFEIELTPDTPITVAGMDPQAIRQVFPFH